MPSTTTATETLKKVLTEADPNRLADALRKVDLGNLLQMKEHDTGTITGVAAVPLPEGALAVLSAHVITSGTAASVGHYMVGNSATTPLLPPGGANTAIGLASAQGIAAPGAGLTGAGKITTVTFPNTVTRVVFRYIAGPTADMTAKFDIA
jgi:hypothetical protein